MQSAIILIRRTTQHNAQVIQFTLPITHLGKDGEHLFPQCILGMKIRVLCKITNTRVTSDRYCTLVRLLITGQEIEQRCFTGTVWAYKSNTIMLIDLKAYP